MHKKQNIAIQFAAIGVGVSLLLLKLAAYYFTTSNAILTDALESIVNVLAAFFALYSLILAARPKNMQYPYGYGKIEFLSAAFEGSLIIIAGVLIIVKSVYNLYFPHSLQHLNWGMLLIAFTGIVNFVMGHIMIQQGKRSQSATLIAGGAHLKSDAYSTIALLAGLGLIWLTNIYWLDNAIAIIFGGIIIYTGITIMRNSVSGIMDEANPALIQQIVAVVNKHRHDNWIDMHNLRIIRYGSDLHIDCHLTLPWYFNVNEAHEEVDAFEQLIAEHVDNAIEIFVHTDACNSNSCQLCSKKDCPVRRFALKKRIEWTPILVLKNARHYRTWQEKQAQHTKK